MIPLKKGVSLVESSNYKIDGSFSHGKSAINVQMDIPVYLKSIGYGFCKRRHMFYFEFRERG